MKKFKTLLEGFSNGKDFEKAIIIEYGYKDGKRAIVKEIPIKIIKKELGKPDYITRYLIPFPQGLSDETNRQLHNYLTKMHWIYSTNYNGYIREEITLGMGHIGLDDILSGAKLSHNMVEAIIDDEIKKDPKYMAWIYYNAEPFVNDF